MRKVQWGWPSVWLSEPGPGWAKLIIARIGQVKLNKLIKKKQQVVKESDECQAQ